jgi:hypothetical protein
MKTTPINRKRSVVLPRNEEHCHIIVTSQMHHALKMYAEKNSLTLCEATAKLLQLGFTAEIEQNDAMNNPKLLEIRKLIQDLAQKSIK